jgi:hypothetical protein
VALTPTSSGGGSSGSSGISELAYAEVTSGVTLSSTTAAGANTIVTAAAITLTGTQRIQIDFSCTYVQIEDLATSQLFIVLWDGAAGAGRMGFFQRGAATSGGGHGLYGCTLSRVLTPSAGSHTYSVRGWSSAGGGWVAAGAGGSNDTDSPAFIRITG